MNLVKFFFHGNNNWSLLYMYACNTMLVHFALTYVFLHVLIYLWKIWVEIKGISCYKKLKVILCKWWRKIIKTWNSTVRNRRMVFNLYGFYSVINYQSYLQRIWVHAFVRLPSGWMTNLCSWMCTRKRARIFKLHLICIYNFHNDSLKRCPSYNPVLLIAFMP